MFHRAAALFTQHFDELALYIAREIADNTAPVATAPAASRAVTVTVTVVPELAFSVEVTDRCVAGFWQGKFRRAAGGVAHIEKRGLL